MQRPLHDHEDAFGRQLLDHLDGRAGEAIFERDDGYAGPALPAATFFAEHAAWPAEERRLFAPAAGPCSTSARERDGTASRRSVASVR
jgi:hypothetical protein